MSTIAQPKERVGLKQRIAQATTEAAIDALLKEGLAFDHASETTKRQWRRVADKRMAELATL